VYEHRSSAPVSRPAFLWRLARHFGLATLVVLGSLLAGMTGYHQLEGLTWLDAFLNAAMLLGGMGPIGDGPQTAAGKLFAGLYALYSGMVFLVLAAIVLAPMIHRLLHRFHWDADRADDKDAG
jgi:hypothetical protein